MINQTYFDDKKRVLQLIILTGHVFMELRLPLKLELEKIDFYPPGKHVIYNKAYHTSRGFNIFHIEFSDGSFTFDIDFEMAPYGISMLQIPAFGIVIPISRRVVLKSILPALGLKLVKKRGKAEYYFAPNKKV